MAECLHLYFCLKAGFELEGKVVIVDRDFLDQLPDKSLIVLVDLLLLSIQEVLDHLHLLPDAFLLGVFQEQPLFLFPDGIDLVGEVCIVLFGSRFFQQFLLDSEHLLVQGCDLRTVAASDNLLNICLKGRKKSRLLPDEPVDGFHHRSMEIFLVDCP